MDKEKARERNRRWRERNPEHARTLTREQMRRYRERLGREEVARQAREWRAANPEAAKEIDRRHRERHRDKRIIQWKEWAQRNPWHIRANRINHRAHRRGSEGRVTAADVERIWNEWDGKCWRCGTEAEEWDHVIPVSRGGQNTPENVRPVCLPCNRKEWELDASQEAIREGDTEGRNQE